MRTPGRFNARGLPARSLDLLETDGGWLTTAGVALELGAAYESADRALSRLRDRGLVESRVVELAGSFRYQQAQHKVTHGTRTLDSRHEWRFVTWGEWTA